MLGDLIDAPAGVVVSGMKLGVGGFESAEGANELVFELVEGIHEEV